MRTRQRMQAITIAISPLLFLLAVVSGKSAPHAVSASTPSPSSPSSKVSVPPISLNCQYTITCANNNCGVGNNGLEYDFDLSAMTLSGPNNLFPDYSYINYNSYDWHANVCGSLPSNETCLGVSGAVATRFDHLVPAKCTILALLNSSPTFSLLDPANVESGVIVTYYQGSADGCPKGNARMVVHRVTCDANVPTGVLDNLSIDDQNCVYTFSFRASSGCPNPQGTPKPPLPPGPDPSNSLSGGWIFIIVLLCGFVVYCVAGSFINYRWCEQRGRDMIPQWEFWFGLPSLVKDGCFFTLRSIFGSFRRSEYNDIESNKPLTRRDQGLIAPSDSAAAPVATAYANPHGSEYNATSAPAGSNPFDYS